MIYENPSYIKQTGDNEWTIQRPFAVRTRFGRIVIHDGFRFDKETVVKNTPDWVPSCVHDWVYVYQRNWAGDIMSRYQADRMFFDLNAGSKDPMNRRVARRRFLGVRMFGWYAWYKPGKPHPIPPEVAHLYPPYVALPIDNLPTQ